MTPVTLPTLIACGIGPAQARLFESPINVAMEAYQIDTPVRQAAFIAQCNHESIGFTALEENLYYSTPARIATIFWSAFNGRAELAKSFARNPKALANRVYARRLGNGNAASGDGWNYRGRGLIHLTGRSNYRASSDGTGRPYGAHPELVALPEDACLSSAWWWRENNCNPLADACLADAERIDDVTAKINPGMAGALARRTLFAQARRAFEVATGMG